MVTDKLIDDVLFLDFGGGTSLEHVLKISKIAVENSKGLYEALLETKLFEPDHFVGSGDSLRLSTFGRGVKANGGWVTYKRKVQQDEEKQRLEMSQLRMSIFQVKYWWLILVISALVSTGLPLILRLFGIKL
jgi:hypothetical protein